MVLCIPKIWRERETEKKERSSELVVNSEQLTVKNDCLAFQALKWRKS